MKRASTISIARRMTLSIAGALMALLISTVSLAADTLEDKQIEQWIAAMPEMQAWGMKNQAVLAEHQDRENLMPQSPEQMVKPIKDAGLYEEAKKLAQKHGFDSPEQFSEVSLQLITAVASIKMSGAGAESLGALQQQLESSKAQLEAAELPAAQKQAMMNQIKQAEQMYQRVQNVSEADKAAVKPYLAKIEAASGS